MKTSALNLRGFPLKLKNKFKSKAALENKNMMQKIIELVENYVNGKK